MPVACIVTLITGLAAGWVINGWRLEAKIQLREAQLQKAVADAEHKARQIEKNLQEKADKLRLSKDSEIRRLNRNLADALSSLQNRPQRGSGITPNPSLGLSAQGCSGAELFREDSEFLAREAARADIIREYYKQCSKQYEEVRRSHGR
jgi:hypothetical protein